MGEARKHHYLPRCWLAGFTESGEIDGRLWVTDLKRKTQWQSSPENAGHQRDFYRIDLPDVDRQIVEKAYAHYENLVAPTLRNLIEEKREPDGDELEDLFVFMALQFGRTPAFRPIAVKMAERIVRDQLKECLVSPEAWDKKLKEVGIPPGRPGAGYEEVTEFLGTDGALALSAKTEWFCKVAFQSVETILPELRKRFWSARLNPSGSYVASDNPVVLDGDKNCGIGFGNADFVMYPVNRHLLISAINVRPRVEAVTPNEIAHLNTLTMIRADERVYSHTEEFCWLDENRTYQTDWRLFDRAAILARVP